ncbi:MAG TPA: Hsp70 family protein, partial [Bacteroidia bacterium]|nr:Hsp70 family protein [Bacteroidia bacterium]
MNTVGIDFGTTKTLVAAVDERSGKPVPISLGRVGYELPTTLYVEPSHQILFGEDADDHLALDSRNYLPRIKRDLGTAREHVLNGRRFTPVDLAAEFLKNVRERVESEHFHGKIDHAVITVPAKYGPAARKDLETAAKSAGFTSFELLDEPIAAGIAFLDEKRESELGDEILVFDWGGGTLDIAMVEHRNGIWHLNH